MGKTKTSHHPVQLPFKWNRERRNALALLGEYYLLRVKDFAAILNSEENDNTRRSMQNILTALHGKQFVGRLRFVDDESENTSKIYAYYLNASGAAMLENPTAQFATESKFIPRHEIEITKFHISLKKWCDREGLILHWHQPKMDHKKSINPDAYFGIEDPKKSEGHNTLHYFLEIERSPLGNYKNGQPSIIRKLGKYYDFYDSDQCEKEWGFRKFRVITVVRNSEKQLNLCERLTENYSHRMFWVTNESAAKENIGGDIFTTPKDHANALYSLPIP